MSAATTTRESVVPALPPEEGTPAEAPAQPSTTPTGGVTKTRPGSNEIAVGPVLFRNTGAAGEGFYLVSPSGNVSCALFPNGSTAGDVGCQAVTSVDPADGPACTNAENDKYAVRIDDAGTTHLCTTQGIYVADNATVLQYGEILTSGPVSCVSREDGISCLKVGSNAFLLSRDANSTY